MIASQTIGHKAAHALAGALPAFLVTKGSLLPVIGAKGKLNARNHALAGCAFDAQEKTD